METNTQTGSIIRWTARIMGLAFAAFISIFALDVFNEGYDSFWTTAGAFIIHLVPAFLLILVIIIAWRREWIGGLVFILLGIIHMASIRWGQFDWTVYAVIDAPLFLLGILFFISWYQRKKRRGN